MGTLKTNEEIKKEISETMEELSWVVEGGDAHDLQDACVKAHACLADTLALIERLESDASFYKNISALMDKTNREALSVVDSLMESNFERSEKIVELQKDREEMAKWLKILGSCSHCRHENSCKNRIPNCYSCDNTDCPCYSCEFQSNWQWRGVSKEK